MSIFACVLYTRPFIYVIAYPSNTTIKQVLIAPIVYINKLAVLTRSFDQGYRASK